jgi:tetratricopeptide (TPR) repeat protein
MVLTVVMTAAYSVPAAPAEHWFDKANQYYAQQAYDSAAYYYERITESGMVNSAVFFNLGNAYFRLKKLGLARLYYEKAAKLSPTDPDVINNIRFINANIADRAVEPEKGFFASLVWHLHTMLSLRAQLWLFVILLTTVSILIAGALFISGNGRLWLVYCSCLIGFFLCFLGLSLGYKIHESENLHYAIVLSPAADVKNEPDGNKILFTVHEGTKFRIRKTVEGWSMVSLPNGYSGWVESGSLGPI